MLTDAPVRFDLRVRQAWIDAREPTLIVVGHDSGTGWRLVSAALALCGLLEAWLRSGAVLRRLLSRVDVRSESAWAGLKAHINLQARALAFFWSHRRQIRAADSLYAHDQLCGMVAYLAHRVYGKRYDYDAHEIVPFRARRTAIARMLLEWSWERRIVRASSRCIVVNQPMRRIYRRLYARRTFEVKANDFFEAHSVKLDPNGERVVIYIGSTGVFRRLADMPAFARRHSATAVLIADQSQRAAQALGITEHADLDGYLPYLLERLEATAAYVWCSFDRDVLSYRHSLPNKFFQAMALGLPIIAARHTYLGRIVQRHGVGVLVDHTGAAATDPWDEATFRQTSRAMCELGSAWRAGRISL